MKNAKLDDIDMIYEDVLKQSKKAHTRKIEGKKQPVKVRSTIEIARDTYREARKGHNKAIWHAWRTYRDTRKQHILLKRQAHNIYKLAKLTAKVEGAK